MKFIPVVIILSLFVASCSSNSNLPDERPNPLSKTELKKETDSLTFNYESFNGNFEVDSLFLSELEKAHKNRQRIPLPFDEVGGGEVYRVVQSKLNFTPDTVPDYFITDFETRFAQSYIVDGRNGRFIPFSHDSVVPIDETSMFWHRPVDGGIVPEEINVDCKDDRSELLITHTTGFDGFASYLIIYRYNEHSDEVDLIFKRTIFEEITSDESDVVIRDSLNYVDVLYKKDECFSQIEVFKGKSQKERNYTFSYLDITPFDATYKQRYVFDTEKNRFELKK